MQCRPRVSLRIVVASMMLGLGPATLPTQVSWTDVSSAQAAVDFGLCFDPVNGGVLQISHGYQPLLLETRLWTGARWQLVTPTTGPIGRFNLAAATDLQRRRVVMFGGVDQHGNFADDTWEWDGRSWTAVATALRPAARGGHAMAYDAVRKVVVLFGGFAGPTQFLSDTWEWDGRTWTQRAPPVAPGPRWGHEMTYDVARGVVLAFGGTTPPFVNNELWQWNGAAWRRLTVGIGPPPRLGPGLTYDEARGRAVVFGGHDGVAELGDTWEWDGTRWQLVASGGPPALQRHAIAYDRVRAVTVLTGGQDRRGSLTDTWEWDGTRWLDRGTARPSGRFWHATAHEAARDTLLLFGGMAYDAFDDTWTFDGQRWREHSPAHRPPPRRAHGLAHDPARGRTVLFGGKAGDFVGVPLGDTWEWDGTDWHDLTPTYGPPARAFHAMAADTDRGVVVLFGGIGGGWNQFFRGTWEWNGTAWTHHAPASEPPPRNFAAMAYDPVRRVTVLFGGYERQFFADTWEWNGTDWRQVHTAGSPSAREEHGMAFDVARHRVVLFGGYDGTTRLDDTWEYDGTQWTQRRSAVSPIANTASQAMVYDAKRRQSVLHGAGTWVYGPDDPAAFVRYGFGCLGSAGIPDLRAGAFQLPWTGGEFRLEVDALPRNLPTAFSLGASDSMWGGLSLPFDLTPFGMTGCRVYGSIDLLLPVANVSARASLTLGIPNDTALVGGRFFAQVFAIDPTANAAGVIASNGGAATVGAR